MLRILLVEDFPASGSDYGTILEEAGFAVDRVGTSAEALELAARITYSLVCINMIMLEYNGFAFIERFRLQPASDVVKLIILSNIDRPRVLQRAKALGTDRYLIKSHYTLRQFAMAVTDVLETGIVPAQR